MATSSGGMVMSEKINVVANIILFMMFLWSLYERYKLEKDIKILKWQLDHSRKICIRLYEEKIVFWGQIKGR